MTEQDKKEVAAHFNEAMEREDLYNAQAARFLNLNPCYITWIKNEKYWPDISIAAWDRFEQWHLSREKLSEFKIPEGEPIWEKKKNHVKVEIAVRGTDLEAMPENEIDEHSPENLLPEEISPVRQKRKYTRHDPGEGKSVKIVLQKQEIRQMNKRIDLLIEDNNRLAQSLKEIHTNNLILLSENEKLGNLISDLGKKVFIIEDESLAVLARRVKDLEEGVAHLVTLPKQESRPSIILFPKYIYKS